MSLFSYIDFIIAPIYLILLLGIGFRESRKYRRTPLLKYYNYGLAIRLCCTILFALIYEYYFLYGDTFGYFYMSGQFVDAILDNLGVAWELFFYSPRNYSVEALTYIEGVPLFSQLGSRNIMRFCGLAAFLSFKSYLGASFLLTYFAFKGCWKIFLTFLDIYPNFHKYLAISTLFIPSVFFWGTSLMKDSICIGALGFLLSNAYILFIKKKKKKRKLSLIFYVILNSIILINVKPYIFIIFVISFSTWFILSGEINIIRNKSMRKMGRIIFLPLLLTVAFMGTQFLTIAGFQYDIENVESKVNIMRTAHLDAGGSSYDLGKIDPSIGGFFISSLAAFNVTLFRPYFWEVSNLANIPAALESFLFLIISLKLLLTKRTKIITKILERPELVFCASFTFLLATLVGLVSANFGTLVRYKIPLLPFYAILIFVLLKRPKPWNKMR